MDLLQRFAFGEVDAFDALVRQYLFGFFHRVERIEE